MGDANPVLLPFEHWEGVSRDGVFEDSLIALREVVGHLETGQLRLVDSVRCFEIGTLLARRCERLLEEAELRISRLDAGADDFADTDEDTDRDAE